jgi:nucleoside-diphosphate-sugar epimerase
MKVFVAGATGAIGKALLPRLVRAGHAVTGLTHTARKAGLIHQLDCEPVVADALDEPSIRSAVMAARPDVIVHEMTDLKGASDLRHFDSAFDGSNRLRTAGTDHLLAAARNCGVRRMIVQSFCGWPYARSGAHVKDEEDALDADPPAEQRRTLDAIRYMERVVTASAAPEGVVLRYGAFYGEDTGMFDAPFVDQIRKRCVPLIGSGAAWWSFVHIEDAADATVLAVERGRAGIYNIVDDEPVPVSEWLPATARMLGAKAPHRVPGWLARFLAGEHLVAMMTQSRGGSNAKAKRELGWQPRHASWRDGFAEIAGRKAA